MTFDFLFQFMPVYLIFMTVLLAPTILIIIAWKSMDFLINRFGDRMMYARQTQKRLKKIGDNKTREELLHSLRTLEPKEFEYYMASIFTNAGFEAEVVGGHGSGDGGIDIILRKDKTTSFVQCKKYIGRGISVAEVRDFYGAIADKLHGSPSGLGYYMTTTFFTDDARKFAKNRRLVLYEGDDLMDIVFRQEGSGEQVGLAGRDRSVLLRGVPPICPVCRRSLAVRNKEQSTFVGCTGYPSCRYTFSVTK